MMASFAVTASAAFTDEDQITYSTAVEALTTLEVISGYSDGSFRPTNNVTRGAFAKMVAYVMNGGTNAAASYGTYAAGAFSDVAATSTFGNAIGYVTNKGIVSGYADGTFRAGNSVTGLAAAKMLLGALGYKSEVEGYTGEKWKQNVIADGEDAGLFAGLESVDLTANLSREAACQMIWNALQAKTVTYSGNGVSITTPDGTVVNTGASAPTEGDTLAKKCFKSDITFTAATAAAKPFGTYKLGTKELAKEALSPVKTYTAPVSYSALYNDLGLKGAKVTAKWYIDGYQSDTETKLELTKADTTSFVGGNSVTTNVYKVGTEIVVSQYANYLAKVTKVTPAKAATATTVATDATVDLVIYGTDYYGSYAISGIPADGFAKNDMVIVTLTNPHDGDKIAVETVSKASSFDGAITKYTSKDYTVNGTSYKFGAKYVVDYGKKLASVDFNATYTFYTDANGVILGAEVKADTAAVPTDYVYVVKTQYQNANSSLLTDASQAAKAQVIFTDGTSGVINLTLTNKGTATAPDWRVNAPYNKGLINAEWKVATASNDDVNGWYAYTVSEDGSYNLTALNSDYAATSTVALAANTTTKIGDHYTTSSTKVVTIDVTGTLTTTTGYPAAAKNLGSNVLYTYAKDAKTVSAIYAVNQSAPTTAVTFAYAVEQGSTVKGGTEWTFSINGAQDTCVITEGTVTAGGVYTLTSTKDGYKATAVSVTANVEVAVADTTLFIAKDGTTYTYAPTAAVYNVDKDNATVIGETDTIEAGDKVTVIVADDKVAVAYITTAFVG